MKRFEYKSITLCKGDFNHKTDEILNELGIEGWELVSAFVLGNQFGGDTYRYTFKREIQS